MNLRKNVKAPKRYTPELDDAPAEERYMPTIRKPLFQAQVIEYNPHLPPAAFPTLDKPRPEISEIHQGTELGSFAPQQPRTIHAGADPSRPANSSSPGNATRGQRDSHLFSSPVRHEEPASTTHELSPNLLNCTQPTYPYDMSSSGPLCSDMLEAVQCEMETSDEETKLSSRKQTAPKHKSLAARSRPSWQNLSPVLRIEILHALMDQDVSPEIASSLLGISPEDWQEIVKWDTQREQVSEREDTKIQGMQEEIHRLLLDGGPITKVTTSAYNRIFDRHLGSYMRTDKWHFDVCTKKQLEAAHTFLRYRGLSRSLAGRWDELESGNTYDYWNVREKASETDMSKIIEQIDSVTIQPAVNQNAQDPKFSALITSSPVHERGRSPVRRRYIRHSQETSPSFSHGTPMRVVQQELLVAQPQYSTPKNMPNPYRPLAIAPDAGGDTIMQDVSNLPLPGQTLCSLRSSLPLKGCNAMVPLQLPANEPKRSLPTEPQDDSSDSSTILVLPKRVYTGTAQPTIGAALLPLGNGSFNPHAQAITQGTKNIAARACASNGNLSEVMERLRRNSLKHTAKAKPKSERQTGTGDQNGSPKVAKGTGVRNAKKLSVSTSHSNAEKPFEDTRRASTGSLTAMSRSTTAGTPNQDGQDSPITPVQSGSSTRSSRVTQLPARYRDDLVETPTAASRPRKSSQLKGVAVQAKATKAGVASKKPLRGRKAPVREHEEEEAPSEEEEEDEDEGADHTKRLASSPPGSQEPPPKKQAGRKRVSMPTPSVSRSDTAQSSRAQSRAESVLSTADAKKGKENRITAGPKAGKAPRKKPPRLTR